ncbi:MAG: hypothetical protein LBQ28_03590 [Prevotellaceae bacterium]|nr:hypothetical protein [Prevotellaceae bacterium]
MDSEQINIIDNDLSATNNSMAKIDNINNTSNENMNSICFLDKGYSLSFIFNLCLIICAIKTPMEQHTKDIK